MTRLTPSSNPHRRTRRDHDAETGEDYVEAVAEIRRVRGACRVADLARHFAVSHVTVTRIVARLQQEGLLDTEPYRPVSLTAAGRRLAARVSRRHETVYRFFLAIGVDVPTALSDAEGIEHHVSPKTLHCFRRLTSRLAPTDPDRH
ncbi:MAG: iron dependent repressor, metal binding and dimerization domain protein [Thermoguttaceae bacterium]